MQRTLAFCIASLYDNFAIAPLNCMDRPRGLWGGSFWPAIAWSQSQTRLLTCRGVQHSIRVYPAWQPFWKQPEKEKRPFSRFLNSAVRLRKPHSHLEKANHARLWLNNLYMKLFVTPGEVAGMLNVTHQTASALIQDFEALNILEKSLKKKRSQSYVFTRYFSLFIDWSSRFI